MNRLESRIVDHPLGESIDELRSALGEVSSDVERAIAEAGREGAVERATATVDYLGGLLEAADPRLVASAALDTIQGHVGQAQQAAANLEPDPAGQSAQLEQALDSVLQAAAPLAAAAAGFAKSTQRMGRKSGALTKRLKKLDGEAEMIEEELKSLENRRQTGLDELESAEAEKRAELEEQLRQVRNELDAERQRLESVGAEAQERFDESEKERGQKFAEVLEEAEKRGDAALERTEAVAQKVEDLYGVVTDSATAGEFTKEARAEREAADRWRRLALGFGSAAAVVAIVSIALAGFGDPSVAMISAKLTATITLLGLAAYAARQSGQHRDRANDTKDLALELVTFEGELHGLDPDEQRALRKQFIERAFRGRSDSHRRPGAGESIEAFGVTPEVISLVAAALKATQAESR